MIVLDASALADFLLERGRRGDWAAGWILSGDTLHAPHLIDVEIASVVRRRVLDREISSSRGRLALEDLADVRLTRYPALPLLDRMWDLRANLTAYDATYVALAEVLDAPLVTADERIAKAPGHSAVVELFPG